MEDISQISEEEVSVLKDLEKSIGEPPIFSVKEGHISQIDLGSKNLRRLPESIGDLIHLTNLNLSYNMLKELPRSICNLSKLSDLNIAYNELERLPECIGMLPKLISLNVSHNRLRKLPKSSTKIPLLVIENNYIKKWVRIKNNIKMLLQLLLYIVFPIFTLYVFHEYLFINLVSTFSVLIIFIAILLYVKFLIKPPKMERKKIRFLIFNKILDELKLADEHWFNPYYSDVKILEKSIIDLYDPDLIKSEFLDFYIHLELYILLYAIYIPIAVFLVNISVIEVVVFLRIMVLVQIFFMINGYIFFHTLAWLYHRIRDTKKIRHTYELRLKRHVDNKEVLPENERSKLEFLLNFLDEPIFIYPFSYKIYIAFTSILGLISIIITFS